MGMTPARHARAFLAFAALALALLVLPLPARAAFDNTNPRGTFAGNHNYVATGNTLRTQSNNGDSCAVGTSSNATVSGIPAGSTVVAAYLYWGGSGTTPDNSVSFGALGNVQTISPDQNFTDNFTVAGQYDLDYFGGFKDVTSQVSGNGTYQFGDLTVATTDNFGGNGLADYCAPSAVVAGWSLIVVYTNPSEDYRYTRIYDGLRYFRGSSVTTTQSGFRVPDLLNGKVTVVTWEGDPDATSSVDLDGYSEALSFDGYPLSNAGCDAASNLYNSTVGTPSSCSTTSYGVDVDTYDVTPYLYEGQTGATLQYSSGNDLVLLTAQVISTTNTPVADLGIDKSHSGDFTAGQNGNFSIVVHNYGPEIATGTATVTDTLPAGMTFVSGTGTGWTCGAVGQAVTCNNSAPSIAIGADLPTLTLTVAVAGSAAASLDNTATVSHPMFDGTGGNQTDTDTVAILRSDLSTSTKSVVDLNGGDAEVGDVLRYTITLDETAGQGISATGVEVVDDLPADLGDLSMVSIPAGATDLSVGSGGANGTGQVNVTGITVSAGGSATIVFDATIQASADPGDTITNTATVTNGSGPGATPSVQTEVAASQAPVSGDKLLYFESGGVLDRTPQAGTSTIVVGEAGSTTFTLTGTVARDLVLVAGSNVVVTLVTRRSGNNSTRNVYVQLLKNGVQVGANSNTQSFNSTTWTPRTFTVAIPSGAETWADGTPFAIRVVNNSSGSGTRTMDINTFNSPDRSQAALDAATVVNVDSVAFYSAAYPSTATKTSWEPGDTVYLRADISDPFGGYDVSSASLNLTDANGTPIVTGGVMTAKTNPTNDGATPNRIFEYTYTLGASPAFGSWSAAVTGNEGSEGTVSHTRNGSFTVAPKALEIVKSHSGDFTAGANASYTLLVSNTGTATVSGTTTVKDTLATGLTFVTGTGTGWACGAAGQLVTCTSSTSIAAGASMAPITLTVAIAGNLGTSVANQASVGNSTIGGGFQKAGNTDTAIVQHPNLATSTKSVVDLNGGDANPGDTLRYTITLKETAGVAANGVSVADTLQAGLEGLSGLHASSTCGGTPSVAGSTLTVTGITVGAGGACTLVFDVTISAYVGTGFTIDNTATVTNPNGNGATPAAPTVTVAQSQQAVTGNKLLYVYANNTMTRTPQSTAATATVNQDSYQDFVLYSVVNPLTIVNSSTINIALWLQRSGSTTSTTRNVYVQLLKNSAAQIGGNSNTVSFTSTTLALQNFTITAPSSGNAGNLQPGDTLVLRVHDTTVGTTRSVGLAQYNAGQGSTVTINTSTVVHVDSVTAYSAAYPSTAQATSYGQGETVYLRAEVSDPFGFDDISGGTIEVKDAGGATVATAALVNGTHTVGTPSGATRVYEYAYTVPAAASVGGWTASVTANEGTEGTVSHTGNGGFNVGGKITLRGEWGAGATAGHTVTLAIAGGTSAVAGSSAAPSTLTPATANGATGSTITLSETFVPPASAGDYTVTLACVRDSDSTTVTVSGAGLSRSIVMPGDSVTCTWNNSKTVPLTVVKLSTVRSDPVNGSINPKAIPGAIVEYQIIVTNPAATAADADTIVLRDPVPQHVDLRVVDIGASGSGPVAFVDGSPSSGLSYTFTSLSNNGDDVEFSSDNGATWTYVPVPDANGVDPAVTNVQISPKGAFAPDNAQFTVKLRVRIE
jgi:uncharacterized repeat protein (TIGR01451 family)/fimbrial isopeptide formation D2 family protein